MLFVTVGGTAGVAGDSATMVSVSAVETVPVVAAANVMDVAGLPVTLAMVSPAGISVPEICIPTSDAVTVPVVIVTVVLPLVKVPLTPAGGVGLAAHFSRTSSAAPPVTCCMNATCVPSPERTGEVTTAPVVPVLYAQYVLGEGTDVTGHEE